MHVNIHRMSFANKQPQYREMCQNRKYCRSKRISSLHAFNWWTKMASPSLFNQYLIWFINYAQYSHPNNTVSWNVSVCALYRCAERYSQTCEKTCLYFLLLGCVFCYTIRIGQPLCQQISRTWFPLTSILKSLCPRLCEDKVEDTFSVSLFIVDAVIMTPGPVIVDPVAVSSDSYPAVPDSVQPDSCNLHQGLLQPHLWIFKTIYITGQIPQFFYVCACT